VVQLVAGIHTGLAGTESLWLADMKAAVGLVEVCSHRLTEPELPAEIELSVLVVGYRIVVAAVVLSSAEPQYKLA
jgi:hypothetical protein